MGAYEAAGSPVPTVIGGAGRAARRPVGPALVRVALLVERADRAVVHWRDHAPEFEVVATAATWLELVHSPAFPADLVVLDAHVREPVSIAARVRTCRAAGTQVIALGGSEDPAVVEQALGAGAAAVLPTSATPPEVVAAAREVMGITGGRTVERAWRPAPADVVRRPNLSPGETIALRMYASGRSVKEVAAGLSVQYETAKTYLRRVREKYARVGRDAGRRAELVARATEDGYL